MRPLLCGLSSGPSSTKRSHPLAWSSSTSMTTITWSTWWTMTSHLRTASGRLWMILLSSWTLQLSSENRNTYLISSIHSLTAGSQTAAPVRMVDHALLNPVSTSAQSQASLQIYTHTTCSSIPNTNIPWPPLTEQQPEPSELLRWGSSLSLKASSAGWKGANHSYVDYSIGELQCTNVAKLSGFLVNIFIPDTLPWGQKHSCQQCLCKENISVVTSPSKKPKLLLYYTPKIYCIITDNISFVLTPEKRFKFSHFSTCLYYSSCFLIGIYEFQFWMRPNRNHIISSVINYMNTTVSCTRLDSCKQSKE